MRLRSPFPLALGLLGACTLVFLLHAQQVLPPVGPPTGIACAYNAAPPTVPDKAAVWVQCTNTGQIITSAGGGGGTNAVTWTQTVVTLGAATSATLTAANPSRKALRWMNVGANPMTVAPGAVSVTAGAGMNYNPAPDSASQGGSDTFGSNEVSLQAFSAISTGGTTVIVWEGQ